ncbi:MAG: hypothetical protein LBP23_07040 [Treponema sp.]|nr:hypothetical protein [Treponema sp.]
MMRLGRKVFFPAVFLILLLPVTSCYTTKNVWDKNVPSYDTTSLKVGLSLTLTGINGRAVSLKKPVFNRGYTGVILPAGNADLVFKINAAKDYYVVKVIYSAQNISLQYFFEQGKTYKIFFGSKRTGSIVTGTTKYGIYIQEKRQRLEDADFFEMNS